MSHLSPCVWVYVSLCVCLRAYVCGRGRTHSATLVEGRHVSACRCTLGEPELSLRSLLPCLPLLSLRLSWRLLLMHILRELEREIRYLFRWSGCAATKEMQLLASRSALCDRCSLCASVGSPCVYAVYVCVYEHTFPASSRST